MVIIYGLYTYPRTNPDLNDLYELKLANKQMLVDADSWYGSEANLDKFWYDGLCFYSMTE